MSKEGRWSTALRLAFAVPSMAVIVLGSLYVARGGTPAARKDLDATFGILVGVALLPALIYLVAARSQPAALYGGLAILATTLGAWVFVFTSRDPMRAVGVFPAFFATLAIALAAAVRGRTGA